MQRLSKDQWRRQYKTTLLKEPYNGDWDKLINGMGGRGDTYELLRLNVIAYRLAEEHIRTRLNKKMYWLPKGDEVLEIGNVHTPRKEWFEGDMENWKDKLTALRIEPSQYGKDEAINLLYFFYIFLNDDYEALEKDFGEKDIIDYAKVVIKESIDNYEDAVEELKEYFVENATGKRDDFRGEGVENDNERAEERDNYLEEDLFEVVDLSEGQIEDSLMLKPPTDMPEVEAYDEELLKHQIEPVRDSQGRFIKGQQKVRKPKNIYSSKYPKLNCNTCYKAGDCPEYKPGYVCAYDRLLNRFDTRDSADVMDAMSSMINYNLERLQRAMLFETMDGGMATPEVTGLIDQNAKLLEKLTQLQNMSNQAIINQRRVYNVDGSESVDTSMAVNPSSGGILSKLFGNMNETDEERRARELKEMQDDIIEVEDVEEIKD